MNRRRLQQAQYNGDIIPAADITALKLASVASASSAYCTAYQVPGPFNKLLLNITALPVTVANSTGISFGSKQLLDFPQGRIVIAGGTINFTTISWAAESIVQTGSGDFALGTTATADGTINSTEVDIMASTAMLDPFVAGLGTGSGLLVKSTEFDGTATAKDLFLNVIIDDADVSDADTDTVLFTGVLTLVWGFLGDY